MCREWGQFGGWHTTWLVLITGVSHGESQRYVLQSWVTIPNLPAHNFHVPPSTTGLRELNKTRYTTIDSNYSNKKCILQHRFNTYTKITAVDLKNRGHARDRARAERGRNARETTHSTARSAARHSLASRPLGMLFRRGDSGHYAAYIVASCSYGGINRTLEYLHIWRYDTCFNTGRHMLNNRSVLFQTG